MSDMEPTIQYTIREAFDEIKGQLVDIKSLVQEKADEKELEQLQTRVHTLESFKYKFVGFIIGVSIVSGSVAGTILNMLGGK